MTDHGQTSDTGFSLDGIFPAPGQPGWAAIAEKSLKGKPLEKLYRQTADGFDLAPIYAADDAVEERHLGRATTPWQIGQFHEAESIAALNRQILDDLEGGVNAITLQMRGPRTVPIMSLDDLDRALENVAIEFVPVRLDGSQSGVPVAALKLALFRRRGVDLSMLDDSLDLDPYAVLLQTGGLPAQIEEVYKTCSAILKWLSTNKASLRMMTFDASVIEEAGGSASEAIAYLLAATAAYMRAMEGQGIAPKETVRRIGLGIATGTHLFDNIAKFRALRLCWARLLEVCELEAAPVHIQAMGLTAEMSNRDPWVNMLRGGSQAMAAALGGADRITIDCFDHRFGHSDDMARKVMRNQQLMLQEECGLWRVTDPTAGSWFAENHTDKLAAAAWKRFQEIEAMGGLEEALRSGAIQQACHKGRGNKQQDIAKGKQALTGVNSFPNIDELPLQRPPSQVNDSHISVVRVVERAEALFDAMINVLLDGASLSALAASRPGASMSIEPLSQIVFGDAFEQLRNAADQAPQRPTIFLANLGDVAAHTARATYARNLFAAGGIAAIDDGGFDDVDELVSAFTKSGASIAVICGTDAAYETMAVPVCSALKQTGASAIWLAGRPGDQGDALKAAGLHGAVHMGVDIVAVLEDLHQILGLKGE